MTAIKPEMVADWLLPHEALAALNAVYAKPSISRHLLLERLKSGKILAVAESSKWRGTDGAKETDLIGIIPDQWEYFIGGEEFWQSGDLHLDLAHYKGRLSTVKVWYHAVKFDVRGVDALVGVAPKPPTPAATETSQVEKESPKARLPDPLLRAWYEVFMQAYGGTSKDTEAFAEQSVAGMFPDKSVSRDRIRELRGPQKRGRRPDEAAK